MPPGASPPGPTCALRRKRSLLTYRPLSVCRFFFACLSDPPCFPVPCFSCCLTACPNSFLQCPPSFACCCSCIAPLATGRGGGAASAPATHRAAWERSRAISSRPPLHNCLLDLLKNSGLTTPRTPASAMPTDEDAAFRRCLLLRAAVAQEHHSQGEQPPPLCNWGHPPLRWATRRRRAAVLHPG